MLTKWDYEEFNLEGYNLVRRCKDLGAGGWELVQIIEGGKLGLFKRPIPPPPGKKYVLSKEDVFCTERI